MSNSLTFHHGHEQVTNKSWASCEQVMDKLKLLFWMGRWLGKWVGGWMGVWRIPTVVIIRLSQPSLAGFWLACLGWAWQKGKKYKKILRKIQQKLHQQIKRLIYPFKPKAWGTNENRASRRGPMLLKVVLKPMKDMTYEVISWATTFFCCSMTQLGFTILQRRS